MCQFLVLAGNWQFFVVAGNFHYNRKKKVPVVCLAGVSVFGSGGMAGNFHYDRKKKVPVVGKFSLRPEKKKFQSSVWRVCQFLVLAGNWQFFFCGGKISLRPEKKVPVICLAGVSVFGSGGKLAFFLLWREIFITTGKKKVPVVCLAGVSVFGSGGKLAVFCYCGKKIRYDRKKKVPVVCLTGVSVFGSGGKLAVFLLRRERNLY